MNDLATWLLAQYDADDEAARDVADADGSQWTAAIDVGDEYNYAVVVTTDPGKLQRLDWRDEPLVTPGDPQVARCGVEGLEGGELRARHIARHDPATMLADLAAKRRIVEEHRTEEACSYHPKTSEYPFGCTTCHRDPECGYVMALGWCDTLRLLAQPYANRDGYDPAWAPSDT